MLELERERRFSDLTRLLVIPQAPVRQANLGEGPCLDGHLSSLQRQFTDLL